MSKLVLFLVDGSMLDIRLAKERLTIGRRPDNDVCLPHPAVSAEHAAVVTILADSFLEDLGSTNCTYVNGKPITKHFLRDQDIVEIGRQRLTYLVDDTARVDPLPHSATWQMSRDLAERVDAPPARRETAKPAAAQGLGSGKEFDFDRDHLSGTPSSDTHSNDARPVVSGKPDTKLRERRTDDPNARAGQVDTLQMPVEGVRRANVAAFGPAPIAAVPMPEVRVMSGPNTGRAMALRTYEMSVGRVGVQVALIRRAGPGFRLVPVEGQETPKLNGLGIPADGAPLAIGDTFEVAGVQLTLALRPATPL